MTHEEATLKTKQELAASLKKFMAIKPLNKISVSEIVADCNVNRKTFYYHFTDIYDLLKWMLEQEAVTVVKSYDLHTDYEAAMRFVIDYIEKNAHILNCAYSSMGREQMKLILKKDFIEVITSVVEGFEHEMDLALAPDYKDFVCEFYTEAMAAVLVSMFADPEKRSSDTLVAYMSSLIKTTIPAILKESKK